MVVFCVTLIYTYTRKQNILKNKYEVLNINSCYSATQILLNNTDEG